MMKLKISMGRIAATSTFKIASQFALLFGMIIGAGAFAYAKPTAFVLAAVLVLTGGVGIFCGRKTRTNKRNLLGLALWGLILSTVLIGGLGVFFIWLQTGVSLSEIPHMKLNQNQIFEIIRNAVTAATALGLGVTLVLSYRKQLTLEENQKTTSEAQLVSAKAQRTAADALELSNRQHKLEIDRRDFERIRDLRERYAEAASQLGHASSTVRMAGVYVMATLADDWKLEGFEDQRQACIDVLCSYYRTEPKDEDVYDLDGPVRDGIWDSIVQHFREDADYRRWSGTKIDLRNLQMGPEQITGLRLDARILNFKGSNFGEGLIIGDSQITSGHLALTDIVTPSLHFNRFTFNGGRTTLGIDRPHDLEISFWKCQFRSGRVELQNLEIPTFIFVECTFSGGLIDISSILNGSKFKFVRCTFDNDYIKDAPTSAQGMIVENSHMTFKDCRFAEGVMPNTDQRPPKEWTMNLSEQTWIQ